MAPRECWATEMIWKRSGSMSGASRASTMVSGSTFCFAEMYQAALEEAADGTEDLKVIRHAGVVE
jgi:hypothetical protein